MPASKNSPGVLLGSRDRVILNPDMSVGPLYVPEITPAKPSPHPCRNSRPLNRSARHSGQPDPLKGPARRIIPAREPQTGCPATPITERIRAQVRDERGREDQTTKAESLKSIRPVSCRSDPDPMCPCQRPQPCRRSPCRRKKSKSQLPRHPRAGCNKDHPENTHRSLQTMNAQRRQGHRLPPKRARFTSASQIGKYPAYFVRNRIIPDESTPPRGHPPAAPGKRPHSPRQGSKSRPPGSQSHSAPRALARSRTARPRRSPARSRRRSP